MYVRIIHVALSHQSYRQRKRIRPEQLLIYANNLDDIITHYRVAVNDRDIYLRNIIDGIGHIFI